MKVQILTPEETLFEGDAISVTLPGKGGFFQLLKNHAPLVAVLKEGEVQVVTATGSKSEKKVFQIKGGVCEVSNNSAVVLCD